MSKIIIQADSNCISSMKESALKLGYVIVSYKTHSYGWTSRLCPTIIIDDAHVLRGMESFISMKFGDSELNAVKSIYIELLEKTINEQV